MRFARRFSLPLATVLASILFVGCSNGGSSSNPPATPPGSTPPSENPPPSGSESASVNGFATKGEMRFAQVTAYELDGAGKQLAQVGETETDEEGAYQLTLTDDYQGGALQVVVSVIEGRTRMLCDASNCGDADVQGSIELPSDFSLQALAGPVDAEQALSVSVTAWSTLAAERARVLVSSGKSLSDAIRQANSEVSQIVGFDISKTRSRGLSQLEGALGAEAQYAIMNAAAAELLFSDGNFSTARFTEFSKAMQDGSLKSDDAFTPLQLAEMLSQVLSNRADIDSSAVAALQNLIARLEAGGDDGVTPGYDDDLVVDEDSEQSEKIEAFQRFLSQVRSWVGVIEELDEDALEAAVAVDSDTIEKLVDEGSQAQLQFLGELLDQATGYVADNLDILAELVQSGGEVDVDYYDRYGHKVGLITLSFADNDGLHINIKGALTGKDNGSFLPFDFTLATELPPSMLTDVDTFVKRLSSGVATLSGKIEDGQGGSTLKVNKLSLGLGIDKALEEASDLKTALSSVDMTGDVSIIKQGAKFSGLVKLGLVRLKNEAVWFKGLKSPPIALRSFKLGGEFVSVDGSKTSSVVSVDLRNAASIDMLSWLQHSGERRYLSAPISVKDFGDLMHDWFPETGLLREFHAYAAPADDGLENGMEGFLWTKGYSADKGSEHYQACLKDPQSILEGLGHADYLEQYSEQKACAEATLSLRVVEDRGILSPAYKEQLYTVIQREIARRYGADMALATAIEPDHVWIDFESGYNLNPKGVMNLDFRLPEFKETSKKFLQASFTLSSRVNIPELQSAQLTATVNRSSYLGVSVLANIAADGRSYNLELSTDDLEAASALSLRFYNAQGYELNLEASVKDGALKGLTGDAIIDGEVIGSLELRDGSLPFIVFPNGEESVFESLL